MNLRIVLCALLVLLITAGCVPDDAKLTYNKVSDYTVMSTVDESGDTDIDVGDTSVSVPYDGCALGMQGEAGSFTVHTGNACPALGTVYPMRVKLFQKDAQTWIEPAFTK